ncbi:(2Fe-2S)-binding protein [Nocardiopsis composta]|uniref:Ferric iron reductase protein FhuF n=1 Tax=Nocardiopsis composta TaxID=157465 RepID=A0A7W8QHQ2_9ACTN|nr:(2Fe-2S)-binding protein [Nocardiopsis composta]MBB5430657.1 ferric iron reductase protein FhuF [Nocardiopsis composta]
MDGAEPGALRRALDDIARINPFFEVPALPAGQVRPLADLWRDPDYLDAQVAAVRARLAERARIAPQRVEARVAASLFFQGAAARLLSPAVASVLCHGVLADPDSLGWRTDAFGSLAPARTGERAHAVAPGGGAAALHRHVLTAVLDPMAGAVRARVPVASRLLWGDAASALAGAVQALAAARPGAAEAASRTGAELLAGPPLAGLGGPAEPGAGMAESFVRTTCCLYYRLPGFGKCGDCALHGRRPAAT